MDPNPGSFPLVSYVMSRLPSLAPKNPTSASDSDTVYDVEQPRTPPPSDPSSSSAVNHPELVSQMPHLTDPKLLAAMASAISDVSQARSVLKLIGERPDHEMVDKAKAKLAEIEENLSGQLEDILLKPGPSNIDVRTRQAEQEKECRKLAEEERKACKSVIQLDEMHDAYEKLLKDAEKRLVEIYDSAGNRAEDAEEDKKDRGEVNEEVVGILQQACGKGMDRVDLSERNLRFLPEAFGWISGLVVLNVSINQLTAIPDSIAGLQNLEELNVSTNSLELLPDSIGLLVKLKILNVSGNKLNALPDSICQCRSLVELDASFNSLSYLPTYIGCELKNLQKLLIHLNKIRSFPSSVCEMTSLRYLDAHFNELHGLPKAIGKLTNLEVLNLSSNFTDLRELPETFGDLINLRELDLSNNQIHALPDTFGRLDNLIKLNLEQNPLELPPMEIVNEGVQAVRTFMTNRLIDRLAEEERSKHKMQEQTGWLTRSTSMLTSYVSSVSGTVTEYVEYAIGSPKTPKDPYLNQQL